MAVHGKNHPQDRMPKKKGPVYFVKGIHETLCTSGDRTLTQLTDFPEKFCHPLWRHYVRWAFGQFTESLSTKSCLDLLYSVFVTLIEHYIFPDSSKKASFRHD